MKQSITSQVNPNALRPVDRPERRRIGPPRPLDPDPRESSHRAAPAVSV
jgi:hypothetical protein